MPVRFSGRQTMSASSSSDSARVSRVPSILPPTITAFHPRVSLARTDVAPLIAPSSRSRSEPNGRHRTSPGRLPPCSMRPLKCACSLPGPRVSMASATEINMQSIPTAIEQAGYGAIAVNCVTPSGGVGRTAMSPRSSRRAARRLSRDPLPCPIHDVALTIENLISRRYRRK